MKYFLFAAILLVVSCTNTANTKADSKDSGMGNRDTGAETAGHSLPQAIDGCYRQVIGRDTIRLQLTRDADSVRGTLVFDNYEKDSSHGTVTGRLNGDKLFLWYTFQSEGMQSVAELVFQQNADGFVRATGPVDSRGDSTVFQSHDKLSFGERDLLRKIACDQ